MKKEELKDVLLSHEMWVNKKGGERALLQYVDLHGADLSDANLSDADLSGANLSDADLSCANLSGANLGDADLSGADLRGANLSGADLSGVKFNSGTAFLSLTCPEKGSFVGFKKVNNMIVELEIPAEARRSSATSRKCRCEFAKVLSITNMDGSDANVDTIVNYKHVQTEYKVGSMVYPDKWDDNRWKMCSNGIHFFITREEAVNY